MRLNLLISPLTKTLIHSRVDELEKSRFTMGSLFGKYLLVDDDVRAGARLPDGILKTLAKPKRSPANSNTGPPSTLWSEQYPFFCATTCHPSLIYPMACNAG
jgi:hypothetical protein